MYKVFLADDERIIREGIAKLTDWNRLGLNFIGSADNGLSAYRQVWDLRPDILITDIKMPDLNGLDLIAKLHREFPEMKFAVLSGYGEFELACKAMQYGVKHYLLKPCDEQDITEALYQLIEELNDQRNKKSIVVQMEQQLSDSLPKMKEQFLRDSLLNRVYRKQEWLYYKKTLQLPEGKVRLLLFQLKGDYHYIEFYALKNISEECLGSAKVLLSTIIDQSFLLLVTDMSLAEIQTLTAKIKTTFAAYYKIIITVSVSGAETVESIAQLYKDALHNIQYRFYMGDGSIIIHEDVVRHLNEMKEQVPLDINLIIEALKMGDAEQLNDALVSFFKVLRDLKCDIHLTISYCIELIAIIIKQGPEETKDNYTQIIAPILTMKTLGEIYEYIVKISMELALWNYNENREKNNNLVKRMLQLIHDNLDNEQLSLQWLAKNILYMNADYLGKLFKKEMNEKFSSYLMRVRIETAKILISQKKYKMYEVSEKTGFGYNAQYFSYVFKKYTGYTPKKYIMEENSHSLQSYEDNE